MTNAVWFSAEEEDPSGGLPTGAIIGIVVGKSFIHICILGLDISLFVELLLNVIFKRMFMM